MRIWLKVSAVLVACLMILTGCGKDITYSTYADAMDAFTTAIETGDSKTLATVWADMTEDGLKASWEGVAGTAQTDYLGRDESGFHYYKMTYTLVTKPEGSKLGIAEGEVITWYITLENKEDSGWKATLSRNPVFAEFLIKN